MELCDNVAEFKESLRLFTCLDIFDRHFFIKVLLLSSASFTFVTASLTADLF